MRPGSWVRAPSAQVNFAPTQRILTWALLKMLVARPRGPERDITQLEEHRKSTQLIALGVSVPSYG